MASVFGLNDWKLEKIEVEFELCLKICAGRLKRVTIYFNYFGDCEKTEEEKI